MGQNSSQEHKCESWNAMVHVLSPDKISIKTDIHEVLYKITQTEATLCRSRETIYSYMSLSPKERSKGMRLTTRLAMATEEAALEALTELKTMLYSNSDVTTEEKQKVETSSSQSREDWNAFLVYDCNNVDQDQVFDNSVRLQKVLKIQNLIKHYDTNEKFLAGLRLACLLRVTTASGKVRNTMDIMEDIVIAASQHSDPKAETYQNWMELKLSTDVTDIENFDKLLQTYTPASAASTNSVIATTDTDDQTSKV